MMRGEIVYLFIYMNSWSWGIQVQDVFVKNIRKCQLNYNNLDKRKRILSYDFIGRINKLLAISRSQWHSVQQFIIDRLLVFDLRQSISYWRSFRFGQEKQNILVSITTSVLFQGYFNPIYKLNSIFYIFNYLYCTTRNINISPKKKKPIQSVQFNILSVHLNIKAQIRPRLIDWTRFHLPLVTSSKLVITLYLMD